MVNPLILTWQSALDEAMLPVTASPGVLATLFTLNENENPSADRSILLCQIIVDALLMVIIESASIWPEIEDTKC